MSTRVHARMSRASVGVLFACAFSASTIHPVRAQTQNGRDVTNDAQQDAVYDTPSSLTDRATPSPPQHPMASMDGPSMIRAMDMDDSAIVTMLSVDRLERFDADHGAGTSWKASASIGGDFDKLRLRSEGDASDGAVERGDVEVLWAHAIAPYWDAEIGARHDFGYGVDRDWLAFGVQGLAPYGLEVGATAYAGDGGRTALRLEVDYDTSLSQRFILQPQVEINAYGRSDVAGSIGSGLSDAEFGLRLRYELRREFAPYLGVERMRRFGETASLLEANGESASETRWVIGVRAWY